MFGQSMIIRVAVSLTALTRSSFCLPQTSVLPSSQQRPYSSLNTFTKMTVIHPRVKMLADLLGSLSITPHADGSKGAQHIQSARWHIPAGLYTPKQIVESCSPLLETVLYHLGPDSPNQPARKMLLDNLASNLRTDTRESTLRLPDSGLDTGRSEIAAQAKRIGKTLVRYARETRNPESDPRLDIRSPCEGHLLSNAVAGLMFGPRSETHLMQLYNEYLHQMVLLRDALLPFENFEDVIIPIQGQKGQQLGMRGTQQSRSVFLADLLTRGISQNSVFQVARSLLAPELPSTGGYAFQYSAGVVLPAFVAGSTTLRLLRYFPARLVENSQSALFDYELEDYYVAPRIELGQEEEVIRAETWPTQLNSTISNPIKDSSLGIERSTDVTRPNVFFLKLRLEFDDALCSSIDLGQISKGYRYAYHAQKTTLSETYGDKAKISGFSSDVYRYSAQRVLSHKGSGLITSGRAGIHLITVSDPIVQLALLGRIYPENTVLLDAGQSFRDAEMVGKGFADKPKFVICLEEEEKAA